ncbi:hypothetical protein HAZT_HAZT009586 [Hyalella azteca]|uniref:N-acetylglucosaminylphosphatidylinositol deacetylase n=1 Tax=Hyalella azteca TaxID=294128 RepID=A0A6A0H1H6_HYAAZ|nr:hypothetical protein HAZT_HAZT009586 [Hyalella azteca]
MAELIDYCTFFPLEDQICGGTSDASDDNLSACTHAPASAGATRVVCTTCLTRDAQPQPYSEISTANSDAANCISEDHALKKSLLQQSRKRRVMFVTSHPDDECMFFGPSILHFAQNEKALVYLLCLTDGSYQNVKLGKKRQQELWASCKELGIPEGHITLYKCRHIPDDPNKSWPIVTTANIINHHLHALSCDMVITFDSHGVSGHINHRSLYAALVYLLNEKRLPHYCSAYTLDSVNLVRKYSSVLDIACSAICSSHVITASSAQFFTIRRAMKLHASQYVWFRKLYLLFSRYVIVNTLSLQLPSSKPYSPFLKA